MIIIYQFDKYFTLKNVKINYEPQYIQHDKSNNYFFCYNIKTILIKSVFN